MESILLITEITKKDIGDCMFHWFVPDGNYVEEPDRQILKAEYTQIFGSLEILPLNFDRRYRYYIVEK